MINMLINLNIVRKNELKSVPAVRLVNGIILFNDQMNYE